MKNFPLCLQPKVSKKLLVLDRISSRKDEYQSPISNDKEISLACDKDILKDKVVRWNKGDNVPVSAKLFLPVSCYLPGQTLPICVQVKHVAPIKQMQGIQIHLERLVSVTKGNGEKSMDSQVVAQVTLPLICDVEDTSASINSHLDIPKDTIPTTLSASPIQVTYRLRAAVHVDMASLVEEPTTPLRKRDIAKGMVNSWGKRSNSVQESASTTSLFGSVLDLELPIVIGTTAAEPSSPTDDAKHFFLEDLPPQLPARRPKSAMFLTHQSSSPALFTSAEDEKKLLDRRLHHPKPPLPPRSVTDPFSLINHQQDTWSPVQPSAPDFHDFCTDTKIAP
ncbi:hypothetical protein DM01DRAFT_1019635 [Hesseltinella vesiculosa]|uniref:Arrestin C-terminal-like domain-containing protein n=1 Tax=Hesseltinella vesiculosa TaxID=101127 RepID=A0A1X2GLA8_9FUNG|nr:hypothetical protein DM01DRAFT_1019635 [Hesseltinella vesiculosa]